MLGLFQAVIEPSVSVLLAGATARLRAAGIEHPAREARWLAEEARTPANFQAWVARRAAREPLAYIIGSAPFWTFEVAVSPATLIPRADSETLITAALAAITERATLGRVLDLGTGTGCLLLAVLVEFPAAWGLGVDRSPQACALAARNAAALGLDGRCAMLCADWADWAAPLAGGFDLVLANPPYIPTAVIAGLMPEVSRHEPRAALDGGADGLTAYRTLIAALPILLRPDGLAVFELGAGQAEAVAGLAEAAGWCTGIRLDSGGHRRALMLRRTKRTKKSFGARTGDD